MNPIIKWAGGKRKLLPTLLDNMPQTFNTYYEPFVGGGALFCEVKPHKAVLGDSNAELINAYRQVRYNFEVLCSLLQHYQKIHSEQTYYTCRGMDRLSNWSDMPDVDRAARFIYLNKTGYNGLYRVNQSGQFNVPMGSYTNPNIYDRKSLMSMYRYLDSSYVDFLAQDYRATIQSAKRNDFVYFDPPYHGVYAQYTKDVFTENDHVKLFRDFVKLANRGVQCMLSNSDTPLIRSLYCEWDIHEVTTNYSINSDSNGRGEVKELLITTYEV